MSMKKILIVANLGSVIEKGKSILNRSEFMIFSTKSGNEALSIHRKEQVDLIIADLETEDLGGDQLCSTLRSVNELKNVSFILICRRSEQDLGRAADCKVNAVLTKPLVPEELLAKVGQLLNISERKSYRVLIKITVEGKYRNEPFFCSSRDISSSGILIETEKSLERGDLISCSFFLPGSRRIATQGQVMRIIGESGDIRRYGVRFQTLSREDVNALDEFVRMESQQE